MENALSGISPNGRVFVDLRALAYITLFFFFAFLPTEAAFMLVEIKLMFTYVTLHGKTGKKVMARARVR